MRFREPTHRINGDTFTVAFCTTGYWYLRRAGDGTLWRTAAVELHPRMILEQVKEGAS